MILDYNFFKLSIKIVDVNEFAKLQVIGKLKNWLETLHCLNLLLVFLFTDNQRSKLVNRQFLNQTKNSPLEPRPWNPA
jgi:hypothetical protein